MNGIVPSITTRHNRLGALIGFVFLDLVSISKVS